MNNARIEAQNSTFTTKLTASLSVPCVADQLWFISDILLEMFSGGYDSCSSSSNNSDNEDGEGFHVAELNSIMMNPYRQLLSELYFNWLYDYFPRDDPVCKESEYYSTARNETISSIEEEIEGECQCSHCPESKSVWCCKKYGHIKKDFQGFEMIQYILYFSYQ